MDKPLSHDATSQPSAIYVWLVPSEQVLEQPGGWRIRKWDTAPFPEANFTLSPKEDVGPWRIVAESNGATLYSEDFEHDVAITIGGDFADTAQAIAYAENVAKRLSTLPSATEQITQAAGESADAIAPRSQRGNGMATEVATASGMESSREGGRPSPHSFSDKSSASEAAFQEWLNTPSQPMSCAEWSDERLRLAFFAGRESIPSSTALQEVALKCAEICEGHDRAIAVRLIREYAATMPSATLSSPPLPAKPLWGTGWVYGNNYKQRGRPAGSGKEQGEPWYVTEDGMLWSSFDVRYRPDVQSDIKDRS